MKILSTVLILAVAMLVGCREEESPTPPAAPSTTESLREAGREAAEQAKEAGEETKEAAEEMKSEAEEAAKEIAE